MILYQIELGKLKAAIQLLTKLEEGEQPAGEQGWLSAEEVYKTIFFEQITYKLRLMIIFGY